MQENEYTLLLQSAFRIHVAVSPNNFTLALLIIKSVHVFGRITNAKKNNRTNSDIDQMKTLGNILKTFLVLA